MRRRSRAGGGEAARSRRRKTVTLNAPKAPRQSGSSAASPETEVARLTHERDEALLRETANSEILRLISKSPGDLELVFRTILEHATSICNANFGTLFRFDGESFFPVAQFNTPAALLEAHTRRGPFRPKPGTAIEHVMRTKRVSHSADKATELVPGLAAELGGARSQVVVPVLKDDLLIGAIVIYHQEVRPFTDKQIELLQNFASQAAIAIENTRLLNELRQRTTDLTESLEQQIATSEVLSIISSSPGELQPVFQAMLANAVRICDAKFGNIYRWDGETGHVVAMHNTPGAFAEQRKRSPPWRPGPKTPLGRMLATKSVVHVANLATEDTYIAQRDPTVVAAVELGGVRTFIAVPMLKENEPVGFILMARQEVRPFTDKQIELVTNFAAQAVIAIENARLLSELRESLQQQTAASEVLGVISSSPGELEPVFRAMLENATRICEAKFGFLWLAERDGLRAVAFHNVPPALAAGRRHDQIIHFGPETPLGRLIETRQLVHVADVRSEPAYVEGFRPLRELADIGGGRTLLTVPMLKENELVGAIAIYRTEVQPFTDKQIALVQNFAAQAVIAIENARLLSQRQADRNGAKFRCASGNRNRKHSATKRTAPAHERSYRVAGATDCHVKGARRY
jgi:GAF domain-containing protein